MIELPLSNDFHNRHRNVRPKRDLKGRLYLEGYTIYDTWKRLCGIRNCTCCDKAGTRPSQGEYNPETKRYYLNKDIIPIDKKCNY